MFVPPKNVYLHCINNDCNDPAKVIWSDKRISENDIKYEISLDSLINIEQLDTIKISDIKTGRSIRG